MTFFRLDTFFLDGVVILKETGKDPETGKKGSGVPVK